jgi:hypothetical protein
MVTTLQANFSANSTRELLHRLVVASAPVQEENADPPAIGAARDAACGLRLADAQADIPVETECREAENVLGFFHFARGLREHGVGRGNDLLARPSRGWMP